MFDELSDELERLAVVYLNDHKARQVRADALGLDPRAGYKLWVCGKFVAADIVTDRTLQYYGGFEYVDAEHRLVVGDTVFYSAEDERVATCIQCYNDINNHNTPG